MELEEAIKNVKDEINVDKNNLPIAEANEYEEERTLMLNRIEAKETILNHLTKQEKMIELMAKDRMLPQGCRTLYNVFNKQDVIKFYEKLAEESE